MQIPDRPALSASLTGAELTRWYWLRAELAGLARELGTSATGSKDELTARLVAVLDGVRPSPPSKRAAPAPPLAEPLSGATLIPAGQRCTEQLRGWMIEQVGPGFRFDGAMRDFVASGAGRTLADAVEHWHATRGRRTDEIASQFELNRFTRQWHEDHPGGTRDELLTDWRTYRSLPSDARRRA